MLESENTMSDGHMLNGVIAMKCLVTRLSLLLMIVPMAAMASWQIDTTASTESSFKAGDQHQSSGATATKLSWQEPKQKVTPPAEPFFQTGMKQNASTDGQKEHSLQTSVPMDPYFQPEVKEVKKEAPLSPSYGYVASTTNWKDSQPQETPQKSSLQTYVDAKNESVSVSHSYSPPCKVPVRHIYPKHESQEMRPAFFAISVSGSLKENIVRIMNRYHWKVIWKAPYDYNFDGRVTAETLPKAIEKLLRPFPLQAVMYTANHTMLIVQRNV